MQFFLLIDPSGVIYLQPAFLVMQVYRMRINASKFSFENYFCFIRHSPVLFYTELKFPGRVPRKHVFYLIYVILAYIQFGDQIKKI